MADRSSPQVFRLAHFSDAHLGPLPPGATFRDFRLKRLIGSLSWTFNRRGFHLIAVADAIAADIRAAAADHVACTGDIVNIASRGEFARAAQWFTQLGEPRDVSFVPGNHDSYVACQWEKGLQPFAPFMSGEMRLAATVSSTQINTPFPFVRLRKNVALIGLSSALPQALYRAGGALGDIQLAALAATLRDLRERGFARVVLIHHPPFPGLAPARKALSDAAALRTVIAEEGAELILHGHNHVAMVSPLKTRFGTAHAVGVPSASNTGAHHDPAAWNLYTIARDGRRWQIDVAARSVDPADLSLHTTAQFALST